MNYHNITSDDMKNGDGLRTVLWVAGCGHSCPGCHNPVTWDINGGIPFDDGAKNELFANLEKPYISGLTLSGGDPLHPDSREEITVLVKEVKKNYPDKTIWLYTGYCWDEIRDLPCIPYIDVVVDGEFKKELFDGKLRWKGSVNQKVIDVKKSLLLDEIVLHAADY